MASPMADNPFTQAPDEVVRYFDAKGVTPSWDWREFATREHATAFTVAKTAGFDVLDDIRGAVDDAVRNYTSFGDFVDGLEPTLRKKGWWGSQVVTNPRGYKERVQLGSLHRLRTIYWANTRTARAAGEWERIQRTKRALPFLIYEQSVAESKRPEHLGWVGVILRVDDPFWDTHYPPNGWLCQCRVRQISRYEAEQLGYDPATPAPQIVTYGWKNKKTGQKLRVPQGIDPGWHTNPGQSRANNVRQFLTQSLDAMPDTARRVAVRDIVGSREFRALQGGEIPFRGRADRSAENVEAGRISLPVATFSDRLQSLLGAKSRTVLMSNEDAHKQLRKRVTKSGTAQITAADYALVQEMIEQGDIYEDVSAARTFVLQIMKDGRPWAAVVRVTKSGDAVYLKSFRRVRDRHHGETSRNIRLE